MPRIRFTADPKLPADLAHLAYRKGTEADLSDDQANRWLRRGVATIIPESKADTVAAMILAAETVHPATLAGDSVPADSTPVDDDSIDGGDSLPGAAAPARGRRARSATD